jgi:hypothetical protein
MKSFAWYDEYECDRVMRRLEKKWFKARVTTLGYKQFGKDICDVFTPVEIKKGTLGIVYREHVDDLYALRTRMKQLGCYRDYEQRWRSVRAQMRDARDLIALHYDIIDRTGNDQKCAHQP